MIHVDRIWIKNCIISCKSNFQLESCLVLMHLFEQKHKDDPQLKKEYLSIQAAYREQETFLTVEL